MLAGDKYSVRPAGFVIKPVENVRIILETMLTIFCDNCQVPRPREFRGRGGWTTIEREGSASGLLHLCPGCTPEFVVIERLDLI